MSFFSYFFSYFCLMGVLFLGSGELSSLFGQYKKEGARRRAIIIGIDGLRGDMLTKVIAQGDAEGIKELQDEGIYAPCSEKKKEKCARAYDGPRYERGYVWKTAPGWASVLTGANAHEHRVKNLGHSSLRVYSERAKKYPTFFKVLKDAKLSTAASGVGAFMTAYDGKSRYPGIVDYECGVEGKKSVVNPEDDFSCNLTVRVAQNNGDKKRDHKMRKLATKWIREGRHDVMMIVFDQVDSAGHNYGFKNHKKYLGAIRRVSQRVEKIVNEVKKRSESFQEDWLVILTSDHGGHNALLGKVVFFANKGIHGTAKDEDDLIPFILATYGYEEKLKKLEYPVRHMDVAPTILNWFGQKFPRSVSGKVQGF